MGEAQVAKSKGLTAIDGWTAKWTLCPQMNFKIALLQPHERPRIKLTELLTLLVIVKLWKQPKHPSTGDWLNCSHYVLTTRVNPQDILFSKQKMCQKIYLLWKKGGGKCTYNCLLF
jgi:hypothetical protein